jgi:two-component system OmpR family response regulator
VNRRTGVRERVLLVDDDPDILFLSAAVLEREGFAVDIAGSAEEALDKVRVRLPDLVLSDLGMPGLDGEGLLKALLADPALRHIPLAFCTGNRSESETVRLGALGARGLIRKPFDPLALPHQVRTLLA